MLLKKIEALFYQLFRIIGIDKYCFSGRRVNMKYIAEHFKVDFQPKAEESAVVTAPFVRFTVLTPRIIRMEYSLANKFEDRATLAFWYRKQPVPEFKVIKNDNSLEIITEYLHLRYKLMKNDFTNDSLSIDLLKENKTWRYLDRAYDNLKGTARTLDGAAGEIHLQDGLLSRDGWSLIDDSSSVVFDEYCWVSRKFQPTEGEQEEAYKDLYFFGYGTDYRECLKDFIKLSGKTPMIPRWALGNWWSRYWPYTQEELTNLMKEFKSHDIPLSVCIVDMDWHIVNNPYTSGWTGYTWNKNLFPDPKGFMNWLHENGLKTALNLHPADGVYPHEEQYEAMATAMGINPETKEPIDFDITNPRFTKNYFELLHHPHEQAGVDFWWMDWQQGTKTKLKGLDPLPWLNHLHYYDLARDGEKRGFVFSRYGGPGSHRYPIGFSGDTFVTWEALKFQPYFTSTASNIAYGWWSHDIGGHMGGYEDPELYTRWVQYGVFSPILRLHSTNVYYTDRHPWTKGKDVLDTVRDAMKLRHALIPYIYSMMWRNYTEDISPIVPMYHEYPELEEAYQFPNQYFFGTELIVTPFVDPMDKDLNLSRQKVWLPRGEWFNLFTGEHYTGEKVYALYGELKDIPAFAKAGAIIPMASKESLHKTENPTAFDICIFPGGDGSFTLYEDDGISNAYKENNCNVTQLSSCWNENKMSFTIEAVEGSKENIPQVRYYNLFFRGVKDNVSLKVLIDEKEIEITHHYDPSKETLVIADLSLDINSTLEVSLSIEDSTLLSKKDRRDAHLKTLIWHMKYEGFSKRWLDEVLIQQKQPISIINKARHELSASQIRAITEIIRREELSNYV